MLNVTITDEEEKVLSKIFKIANVILEETGGYWDIEGYENSFSSNDLYDLASKLEIEY